MPPVEQDDSDIDDLFAEETDKPEEAKKPEKHFCPMCGGPTLLPNIPCSDCQFVPRSNKNIRDSEQTTRPGVEDIDPRDCISYRRSVIALTVIWGFYTVFTLLNLFQGSYIDVYGLGGGFLLLSVAVTVGLAFRLTEAVVVSTFCHGLIMLSSMRYVFYGLRSLDWMFFLSLFATLRFCLEVAGTYFSITSLRKAHRLERNGYDPRKLQPRPYTRRNVHSLAGSDTEYQPCPMCGESVSLADTTCAQCGEPLEGPLPAGDVEIAPVVHKMKRTLIMLQCIWGFYLYHFFKELLSWPGGSFRDPMVIGITTISVGVLLGTLFRSSIALLTGFVLHCLMMPWVLISVLAMLAYLDFVETLIVTLLISFWWISLMGVYRARLIRKAGYQLRHMEDALAPPARTSEEMPHPSA